MFINDFLSSEKKNQCISIDLENQIISKIILKPPECFKKISYIQDIDNINISNDLITYVIKNKIYDNAEKILNSDKINNNIYNDYEKNIDILNLSSKYDLPPLYLLNIIFKIKYQKNILFIKNNLSILDDKDYKIFNKAKFNDIYTFDNNKIEAELLLYKEYIKKYLYLKNIEFIENDYWFETKNLSLGDKKIKWILYTNKYGSNIKKNYPNKFDKNLINILNLYSSESNNTGLVLYLNNYCCNKKNDNYLNIYFPFTSNKYFETNYNINSIENSKNGDFYKIGLESKTDKVTNHHYYRYYPLFIEKYRKIIKNDNNKNYAMIEIGIDHYRSLKLWQKYFPTSYIYGLDIGFEDKGNNYKIFKCDQSNLQQLTNVSNQIIQGNKKIFFIIDDGSHHPEHQILTFNLFFDKLLSYGGCYIIEDIETSYWKKNDIYGYKTNFGYENKNSAIEVFKKIADDINYEFLNDDSRKKHNENLDSFISENVRQLISGIFFGQNNIIILKKNFEELVINKRDYRVENNL